MSARKKEIAATELFNRRVGDDTKAGNAGIYSANPDAQKLYFKGVHDILVCIRVWINEASPEALATLLATMENQTDDRHNN